MPLDIKLNIRTTEDCRNLVIEDITGDFNQSVNPGGWGDPNQSPELGLEVVDVFVTAYHFIDDQQYTTSFQIVDSLYYIDSPVKGNIKGFKISVPADVISTYIANQINFEPSVNLPDSYNTSQETIEDNIYQVVVRLKINNSSSIISSSHSYSSTCNMRKRVDKLLTSINLDCETCDKSDLDKAILAKSILEGLENK